MAKIVIRKEKKQFVEELDREVRIVKQSQYYVDDENNDFHCTDGIILKEDLNRTGKVKTKTGKEYCVFNSDFIDDYRHIKRLAQIIPLKDIGAIITATGIGPESVVLDAGTGSGAVSIFLARFVKQVYSYDIVQEHTDIAIENQKALGIKNVEYRQGDITKGVSEKNVDLIILDMPEPWECLRTIESSLKVGGFAVVYCPTITQSADFVNSLKDNEMLLHLRTSEIIDRKWEIDERKVRPRGQEIAHSGFMSFVRKIC